MAWTECGLAFCHPLTYVTAPLTLPVFSPALAGCHASRHRLTLHPPPPAEVTHPFPPPGAFKPLGLLRYRHLVSIATLSRETVHRYRGLQLLWHTLRSGLFVRSLVYYRTLENKTMLTKSALLSPFFQAIVAPLNHKDSSDIS